MEASIGGTTKNSLTALARVESPLLPRSVAWATLVLMVATGAVVAVAPWQQTASGRGQVVAYSPLERRQAIPAPIKGRIDNWYGHREGSQVRQGEQILRITDNDPQLLERLQQTVEQMQLKVEAAKDKIAQYDFHIEELEAYRDFTVASADQVVEAAEAKVESVRQTLELAKANLGTAKLNFDRKEPLEKLGYESERALDLARLDLQKAEADVARAEADLDAAEADVASKRNIRGSYQADADAKIAKGRAERQEALGELALAEKDLLSARTAAARQATQIVVSPCDGTILRLQAAERGDQVEVGDPLFIVVPDAQRRAVEIWVDGNDATLISVGRKVRLLFEGFPGVQFSGWPSVAVGTFGGVVDLIDAADDGQGRFRILVIPDESSESWPDAVFLRQGVQAQGWVLLNRVPLWFEIWRRLNGFPPTVAKSGEEKAAKTPKKK